MYGVRGLLQWFRQLGEPRLQSPSTLRCCYGAPHWDPRASRGAGHCSMLPRPHGVPLEAGLSRAVLSPGVIPLASGCVLPRPVKDRKPQT